MVNNCFIFYFLNTLFAFEGKLSFAKDRFEERERVQRRQNRSIRLEEKHYLQFIIGSLFLLSNTLFDFKGEAIYKKEGTNHKKKNPQTQSYVK